MDFTLGTFVTTIRSITFSSLELRSGSSIIGLYHVGHNCFKYCWIFTITMTSIRINHFWFILIWDQIDIILVITFKEYQVYTVRYLSVELSVILVLFAATFEL